MLFAFLFIFKQFWILYFLNLISGIFIKNLNLIISELIQIEKD